MKKKDLKNRIDILEERLDQLEESVSDDCEYDWYSFYPNESEGTPFPVVLEWHTLSERGEHEHHRASFSNEDILSNHKLADAISALLGCIENDK